MKTIYFLGAGFSADAGGPIQNQIIQTLLDTKFALHADSDTEKNLDSFKEFLSEELYITEDKFDKVALEDIFTPIDRCLADGKSFRKYSHERLTGLRENLHNLMARSIQYSVDKGSNNTEYIKNFAEFINTNAKKRIDSPEDDNIAIITTNWDILLDNELSKIVKKETKKINGGDIKEQIGELPNDWFELSDDIKMGPIAVVDYCCYISSLEPDDYIKPGLLALGRKGYNIKYLKLHGSMNWSHCPACQRLYVKFNEKSMFEDNYCKHCKENFKLTDEESIKLKGNLILPTFLKNMSNIQIQLVWQNTGIELSEADKIVFIGYSLPAADFEIRQLLSRFIREDAEIEVVIYPGTKKAEDKKRIKDEEDRYRTFFGKRTVNIIKKTVPKYINEHCQTAINE